MKFFIGLGVALLFLLVIPGCMYVSAYNKSSKLDEAVTRNWANVDAAMTRRMDLIPNLVATVKAVAKHEDGLFKSLAEARSGYMNAKTPEAKQEAYNKGSLINAKVLQLQEKYPDLKSSSAFRDLMTQIEGSENRIGFERKKYNDAVFELNSYCRSLFGGMVAGSRGIKVREPFKATEAQKQVPVVGKDNQF